VLIGGVVARALDSRRAVATLLVFSLGVIVSATLTPLGGDLVLEGGTSWTCDLSRLGFPPLGVFRGLNDASLNVLLFLPLGVAIALLPRSRRTVAVAIGALLLPVVVETTQLIVPALSRGCESADVIDNMIGLAVGFIGGVALRALATYLDASVGDPVERSG
jgi:glycopeptide antibiotics resistance protein